MLKSKCSISDAVPCMQITVIRISVAMAAGRAILKFALNLSFISTPCVFVAAIVVSLMKERLSPNIAPPTIVATQNGRLSPAAAATLTAIGVSTEIVPHEVPIAIEMRHAMMNSPGIAKLAGMMFKSICAVLAAPPASLAIPLNAPASRKMNSMIVMLSSPMPFAHAVIFSLNDSSLF